MRPPRQEDIISEAIEARLESVHTSEPGWILDYDPATKTCTAQSAIAEPYIRENGERGAQVKPPARNARVAFQGGIVFRLQPGDPVLINYCSAALDNWSPGKNKALDPGDDRRHSLSDPIVTPLGTATETPDAHDIILQYAKVKLGDKGLIGTRSPVARKSDLTTFKSSMQTALATLALSPITNAQAIAALTPVITAITAAIAAMSTNVEAT